MKRIWWGLVSCLLLVGAAADPSGTALAAEPVVTRPVFSTISQDHLQSILKEEGYAVSLERERVLVWKIDGARSLLLLSDDGGSIQFYASFGDSSATLKKVNEWNRTKRYSRSYLDDDGDPVLELDLDLAGGVTVERVIDYLDTCRQSFGVWIAEVVR